MWGKLRVGSVQQPDKKKVGVTQYWTMKQKINKPWLTWKVLKRKTQVVHKSMVSRYIYALIYPFPRPATNHCPENGLSYLKIMERLANGPGDLGSVPGRVIPKTQKMVLDASLLNTQHYKVRIKGKVEQSREGVAPSPTPWCTSYRKGSLWVTLDYGRQLYLLIMLIKFHFNL